MTTRPRRTWIFGFFGLVTAGLLLLSLEGSSSDTDTPSGERLQLPAPVTGLEDDAEAPALGGMTLEKAIATRRSIRRFKVGDDGRGAALPDEVLGQLLWAAQGITEPNRKLRATPSAGATYPLVAYAVTPTGAYRYDPDTHGIHQVRAGDHRAALSQLSRGQPWIAQASASVILVADPAGITSRYGAHAERYILLEAGHAAQNVLLQAVGLGLGGVPIGILDESALGELLQLPQGHRPLYYLSIGELPGQ